MFLATFTYSDVVLRTVRDSGFLVSGDKQDLLDAAGAVILVEGFPGGSVVTGTHVGKSWSLGPPLSATGWRRRSMRGRNAPPPRTSPSACAD